MSAKIHRTRILALGLAAAWPFAAAGKTQNPRLDYQTLSHVIEVERLRAGNHDDSGTNEYVFPVRMYGLISTQDEKNKDFTERRKVTAELGELGPFELEALTHWKAPESLPPRARLRIEGDRIRRLVANTMRKFDVPEAKVSVHVKIRMLEQGKRFYFFGENASIGTVSYDPIPSSRFSDPPRTDQNLTIEDETGTYVTLGVHYREPENP